MATTEGPLVLADISGYTKFIAATELEHSDVLVRRMLSTIVSSLRGRLEMAQLEGDAVFFVGEGGGCGHSSSGGNAPVMRAPRRPI